ncbi:MAG: FkbM family methyltransferase, partial [Candidatus Micrarchaeota archaeon]
AEYGILMAASPQALEKIKKISMEYHEFDGHTGAELIDFLKKSGFLVESRQTLPKLGYIFAWRG